MYLPMSDDVRNLNPELAGKVEYRVKPERLALAGDGFDSQLERDWDAELTARGLAHVAHPFTLHLPGGVDYTPDNIAWDNPRLMKAYMQTTIYEVKGEHVKNTRDSRTRFKIAAALHHWAKWIWVTRDRRGQWHEKRVTR